MKRANAQMKYFHIFWRNDRFLALEGSKDHLVDEEVYNSHGLRRPPQLA